ncbi:polysaccharide biosynthesis tyrosine autokinase [Amycolatopsis sp., V23-08]|uniref:non-specific protein-tyrosine kinase n=1 Tax=Amycolatopsis heterodermiae TaxID=3110235 RepID=A0ABU5R868_9PSEU|nr:polysaccharide biosynthesis tyrosine autokinase [Amycolatopsis sp., V23-08]MEA5362343.1 polysaccharide biosynthesis tyrosine autokinase [Amycolatopsis sp., V23-08]
MELAEYLRALRARWRAVVAGILLGVLAAVVFLLCTTPQYSANSQLFVSTRQGDDGTELYSGGSFGQQRVKSYAQVVTTPRVLDPVVQQLRLPGTADELAARVTVAAPLDTVLVDIAVRDADPARAAATADAIGDSLIRVVTQLESTTGQRSPVTVSFVRRASVPVDAVFPSVPLSLGVGLLAGIIAGVAGALVRQAVDTRVRGEADLPKSDAVLGEIPFDRQAEQLPTLLRSQQSARAEAFRKLRTNLQFVSAVGELRSVVVTSAVPAEGKSTTAVNLALTLVDSGLRVVVVDADLRQSRIAHYLGLVDAVGLTTVLLDRIGIDEALQRWGGDLHVLTAGELPPNPSELLGSPAMDKVLKDLETRFDLVVIDSPPLLPVTDAALLAKRATGALLVTAVGRTRRDQVDRAARALSTIGARLIGIMLNRVPAGSAGAAGRYYRYLTPPKRSRFTRWLPEKRRDLPRRHEPVG